MYKINFQERIVSGALDRNQSQIHAYDIVKIIELPKYLDKDVHNGVYIYRKFVNSIGMIVYQDGYDLENVIWFDGEKILLDVIYEIDNTFERAEVAIPAVCVEKMKLSSELYSIFIKTSTGITDSNEYVDLFYNYSYIKKIVNSAEKYFGPI